jgi:RNA recognition motif-containing protein
MGQRLYVGNLSFDATVDSLRSTFSEAGNVVDAHVVTDRETGRSRGFGFVTMGSDAEAAQAITRFNGAVVDGRSLRVNEAEERKGGGGGGRGGGGGGRNRW